MNRRFMDIPVSFRFWYLGIEYIKIRDEKHGINAVQVTPNLTNFSPETTVSDKRYG